MRRRLHEILDVAKPGDRASFAFDCFVIALIVAHAAMLVLESDAAIHAEWGRWFHEFDAFASIAFTIEYLLRLWSCVADPRYARPVAGRLRYAATPLAVVDLVAIAPFHASLFFGADLGWLRGARVLRLGKIIRYSKSLRLLTRAIANSREELLATVGLMLGLLFVASSLMHYAERHAQPDRFGSIADAAWWAIATLTTVGYGDVVPVTALGRVLAAVIAALGIGMFALPTGILGARYVEELRKNARRRDDVAADAATPEASGQLAFNFCPHCGKALTVAKGEETVEALDPEGDG